MWGEFIFLYFPVNRGNDYCVIRYKDGRFLSQAVIYGDCNGQV